MNKDVPCTPEMRFKGFSGNWVPKKLGNFISPCIEYPNKNDKYPLYSLTIKNGVTPKSARYERSHLVSDESLAYKVIRKNQFAYNPMNLRFGALAKSNESFPVLVSKYYDIFAFNDHVDSRFLEEYLTSYKTLHFYNRMATGTLDEKKRVHFSDFVNFERLLPGKEEQSKIADFLSVVDEKINLLKQKHNLLQQYKKGVMQRFFSQKTRFKDNNGNDFPDWEEGRVDSFVKRVSDPVQIDSDATYREIGIRSHGKGVFHKKAIKGKELGNKRIFWVHANAFVVNIVFAWEHAVALTCKNENGFIASHRFPMYVSKDNRVDIKFFLLFFLSKRGKYLLEMASPGGAGRNKTLGQNNFSELKIFFPCLEEQKKIRKFSEMLDEKINLAAKQIELTKTFKKGLLQKMFV